MYKPKTQASASVDSILAQVTGVVKNPVADDRARIKCELGEMVRCSYHNLIDSN